MDFNEKLWDILDTLHLGELFDKYNIPPIVFPIIIILLVVGIIFVFSGSGGGDNGTGEGNCGDGICNSVIGETETTCATDCAGKTPTTPTGKKLIVKLDKKPSCSLLVKLNNANGQAIQQKFGTLEEFKFSDIDEDVVYITIKGPQDQKQESDPITLTKDEETVVISLANSICEGKGAKTKAKLDLSIINSVTGTYENDVKVSITEAGSASFLVKNEIVNGRKTFDVGEGKKYVIYAEKDGFDDYDGSSSKITITSGTNTAIIKLVANGVTCNVGGACMSDAECPGKYDSECSCIDIEDDNCPSTCDVGDNCTIGNGCPGEFDIDCNCNDIPEDGCVANCTVGELCLDPYTNCPGEFDTSCNCMDLASDGCPETCSEAGACVLGNGCAGTYDIECNCNDVLDDGCPFVPNTKIGDLQVCLINGTTPMKSGVVQLEYLTGNLIDVGSITNESEGCVKFSRIKDGKKVRIIAPNLPSTCISPSPITKEIEGGNLTNVTIQIDCLDKGELGYLKVKVLSWEGTTITDKVGILVKLDEDTIIPGSGSMGTLNELDEGFTEEVKVDEDDEIFVFVDTKGTHYANYTSETFFVAGKTHKELTITLEDAPPAGPTFSNDFEFVGITTPKEVAAKSDFEISVSSITYKGIELDDDDAELDVSFGGYRCRVSYESIWNITCQAPARNGKYDALFNVSYNNMYNNESKKITVNEFVQESSRIKINPIPPFSGDTPVDLAYEVTFDNKIPTGIEEYTASKLVFLDSTGAYPGEIKNIEYVEDVGILEFSADTLFKGEYQMEIYVQFFIDGTFYNKTMVSTFTSNTNSESLAITVYPSETVPALGDDISLNVELVSSSTRKSLEGLQDIFSVIVENEGTVLSWNQNSYGCTITMPKNEKCGIPLRFMINDASVDKDGSFPKFYVIDSQPRSKCPTDSGKPSCSNPTQMRACANDYRTDNFPYETSDLISCIKGACTGTLGIVCEEGKKGDMTKDCIIGQDDVGMAKEIKDIIDLSPSEESNYLYCLDMDNDDDVDDDDLKCLDYVQKRVWEGDLGSGTIDASGECPKNMFGGFCFEIDDDSFIPGDFTGDGKVDSSDEEIMKNIIDSKEAGVTVTKKIKTYADFNKDSKVDTIDEKCFNEYKTAGVNLEEGIVLRSDTPISENCLKILGLECGSETGDINNDGLINERDWSIVFMMAKGLISEELINTYGECADINHYEKNPYRVDQYDLNCIQTFVQSENEHTWAICQDCEEYLEKYNPKFKTEYEICDDGEDNNCDGLVDLEDPKCACDKTTPYTWVRDSEDHGLNPGIEDDTDYEVCRKLMWADYPDYEWISNKEVESYCDSEVNWARQMVSADEDGNPINFTCVFDYPEGFKYPDNPLADSEADQTKLFNWLQGNGNVGPLGGLSRCGSGHTPDNWVAIKWGRGGCCSSNLIGSCRRHDYSYLYRFKYDFCGDNIFCVPTVGDYSGPPLCLQGNNFQYLKVSTSIFNNELYNEVCDDELECKGVYDLGHMAPNDEYCQSVAIECGDNDECCWDNGCANIDTCPPKMTCSKDDY